MVTKKNANFFNTEFQNDLSHTAESMNSDSQFIKNRSVSRLNESHLQNSLLKGSSSKKKYDANWRLNEYYTEDSEPSPIEVQKKLKELSSSPEKYSSDKKSNSKSYIQRLSADYNPFNVNNSIKYEVNEEEGTFITPK